MERGEVWQTLSMSSVLPTAGFQSPRHVSDAGACYFYHSIELPGLGLQVGHWDLRDCIDVYLGKQTLQGRTIVDVGAASGYVSFEMERRGADVISFDRLLGDASDNMGLVPFADFEARFGMPFEKAIRDRLETQEKLQNSYWLAHRLLGSKTRLYCSNVYDGLVGVDSVDITFFGSILLHLRDPLMALQRFAGITRESLIITDTLEKDQGLSRFPVMFFRPNIRDGNIGTWWWTTPKLYRTILEVMGFTKFTYHEFRAKHAGGSADMYTLVAGR
jgi:hypothetical protein